VTSYPNATDYQLALQHPHYAFQLDSLRQAELDQQGDYGPRLASGTTAVVFRGVVSGSRQALALRCYTREVPAARQRYAALADYVTRRRLTAHVGKVTWHDDAVRVNGETWPVLQMDWIDGRVLDVYVGYLVETQPADALTALAARWLRLVRELQQAEFAHGDLQHGNVIVDQHGSLRLVDFDDAWIPTLTTAVAPDEIGHPNYQHPGRRPEGSWGRWVDTFAGLVIYVSLVALARDPGLWAALHNEDNLLFERRDFSEPFDTEVWKRLEHIGDPEVSRLADRLRECCAAGWDATCGLDDLISPWWQRTCPDRVRESDCAVAVNGATDAIPPPPIRPSQVTAPPPPPMPSVSRQAPWPGQTPIAWRQPASASNWWQPSPAQAQGPARPEPARRPARTAYWVAALVLAGVLLITGLAAKLPEADLAGAGVGCYAFGLRWLLRRQHSNSGPSGPRP
jgi:eukaryotic-like serine/threonine-protein kinase